MKTHFYIILAIWVILTTNKAFAQSHITVLPGTTVEVGEEVYFDAVYYSNRISDTLQFEWDFGDGYFLGAGKPALYTFETGFCAIHYFMRPGIFKVKMTASSFDMSTEIPARKNILAVDSVLITVTGETPLAGFELWHAPFHARTAQYLYAIVPDGYSPSQVVARVERVGGGYSQELTGTTVNNKQRFLLNTASLPSGDYVLTAELINGETVVSRIREKFSKPYEGAPTVGINENNAFVLNGSTLFFPLALFMLDGGYAPLWQRFSNAFHTEDYYDEHTKDTWVDYIGVANAHDMMAIGPGRWKGFIEEPYTRNSNPNDILTYVEQAKNTTGLFGWCWDDEPNMGGWYFRVPAHVIAAWDYRTCLEDPQHPTS